MTRKLMANLLLVFALTLFNGCGDGKMEPKEIFNPIQQVPESAWKKVAAKRIYFGHQSVGYDIIDGIKDLVAENPQIDLKIVESADPKDLIFPALAHSKVGTNSDPNSKVTEFTRFMDSGLGEELDMAFLKLCYVDVTANTDATAVFGGYKEKFSYLKKKYPGTTFIHLTVPLTTLQTGVKAWVKQMIGRSVDGYEDNIKREQINEMIRKEYAGKEPVFDLAMIESTKPGGSRSSFKHEDRNYYSLVPEYTYDGGHLNKMGRRIVAGNLLVLLANLSK
jgi:hypothetical protein